MTLAQVALAFALGGALLLVAGGVVHARGRRGLAAVLATQRLVPRRLRGTVAAIMGPLELVLGAAAVLSWLATPRLAGWPLAATAGCYAAFGLYTTVVRVSRPAAPCGCLGGSGPVTYLVVARAWAFALAAGTAAALLPAITDHPLSWRLWPLMPAVLVALTAWLVPEFAGLSSAPRQRAPGL